MTHTTWWLENIYGEIVAGPYDTEREAQQALSVIPAADGVVPRMVAPKPRKRATR